MKRTSRNVLCCLAILACAPAFSKQVYVSTISLKEAKHYHSKSVGKVYIRADRFLRQANANYYKLIVQSEVKYPVHVAHGKGFYYVIVGPLSSASEVSKVANKLKYDPGLSALRHPVKTSKHTATANKQLTHIKQSVPHQQAAQVSQAQNDPVTSDNQAPQPEQSNVPEQAIHIRQSRQRVESDNAASSEPHSFLRSYSNGNWLVSTGLGVSFPSFGSSMSINNDSGAPAPFNKDIYTTKSRPQNAFALQVGYRWVRANKWLPAFSVNASYQHLFSKNVGNKVIQYSDPTFTNYSYDWALASDVLMALIKANIVECKGISPYLLGGVGGAFNRMSNYSEGPLPGVTPRTNPAFGSNAQTSFAYRVGAGLEYKVDPQVLVSAEYQFQRIGSVNSKSGAGDWSGQSLNLGSYQSNALLLNVTYLFDAVN